MVVAPDPATGARAQVGPGASGVVPGRVASPVPGAKRRCPAHSRGRWLSRAGAALRDPAGRPAVRGRPSGASVRLRDRARTGLHPDVAPTRNTGREAPRVGATGLPPSAL